MPTVPLRHGAQRAAVTTDGGRLSSYAVAGRDVIAGHQDPTGPYAYRGSLLAPWPNRVAEGRWSWNGRQLQLPVNDPAVDAALHGLVAHHTFQVVSATPSDVLLESSLAASGGYPFPLLIRSAYALSDAGLSARLAVVNVGDRPAPVGLGVHTYLAAPDTVDQMTVRLPAATVVETDQLWRETGRVPIEHVAAALRMGRPLGGLVLDHCFTDLERSADGRVEVHVQPPRGSSVVLWAGPTCRHLVVYTGDTLLPAERRRSIAIEPMTCPANALRSGIDLDVVPPGQSLRLDWGLRVGAGSR